jgi:hypothetical protein
MGLFDTARSIFTASIPSFIGAAIGGPGGAIAASAIEQATSGQGETRAPTGTWGTPGSSILDYKLYEPTQSPILGSNVGVDVFQPTQTQETKISGEKVVNMYENGPMQAGAVGALVPFAQQLGRTIFGTGAGGAIGGAVGGALLSQGVQQYMGAGDACGCSPKPFVRLDKCGRPIITRAMQSKAKDMVMCMGIENAAAALGISVPLLAEIAFKKFKPRARGISGAQLKTATRVNNKVMHMAKKLEASCKRPAARRR